MDELNLAQKIEMAEAEKLRAQLIREYFGYQDPIEMAYRYYPLPFGLRSGKYGPLG